MDKGQGQSGRWVNVNERYGDLATLKIGKKRQFFYTGLLAIPQIQPLLFSSRIVTFM